MKKNQLCLFIFLIVALSMVVSSYAPKQKKVLVFSKTAGFRHKSAIQSGKKELIELGKKNKFGVDTTESAEVFTKENLKQYAAIVFYALRVMY